MARDLNRSIKVYIDNSDAMAKAQALESRISKLRGELQKLNAQGKQDTKEHAATQKALNQLERSYGNYQNKVKETERILKNLSGSTYRELQSVRRTLRRELQQETRGTEQYTAKLKAYHAVQKEISVAQKEMNSGLGAQGTLMSRLSNGFNKYFGMVTTGVAAVTGLSFTLRKLSQDAAEMDDIYSDVMKTTENTKEEVLELNEVFKQMDTRTSREQLNMLARDAGKLGFSAKKDILDFVEAADQIEVALGEDLGEGAIREVGKMSDVFTRSTKEFEGLGLKEKMLAVGSAINEIGASSTANEQYLVQFTGRLGGVATQAGIGIDKIMGYASALDQDMQSVEMSATALQQLIMKIMGEPAKFAEIAKMEVSEFSNLLKTDANQAIITVLRSLNEQGGFQELIPIFEGMKLSGTRAVGVLSSLAGSIDKVEEAQALANKSMVEATSLTDEFNIKNNNANAELEKRRKAFKDAAEDLGKRLNPALLRGTSLISQIVRFLPSLLTFFEKYGRYVMYLVTVYAAYTAGVRIAAFWETRLKTALTLSNIQLRAKNIALVAGRVAALAYNGVMALLTGNIGRARAAWRALNAAMATNPIGLIAVAATAAVAGIVKLVRWLNRTTAATKAVRDATKQFNSELAAETREANQLFDALRKTNPESKTHLEIRKEIISKYGQYLQGLVDEKGNITDIGEALKAVNNGLREQIALKIRNQAAENIMTDTLDKQADITDKALKRIGKQIENEHVLSDIRETINRAITDFTAEGSSDYAELQRTILTEIQQTYGVDAYKGVFNVKNVVEDLVDEVEKSGNALEKVDEKFSGIISKYTDVNSVLQFDQDVEEDPGTNPTGTTPEEDADIYKGKLQELEKYIANEKALLQEKYVNEEITKAEFDRQLEYLEQERLRKNLELAGISFEQQREIEFKIFETKREILQKIRDEETEHQRQLAEIQEKADKARSESNWKTLREIAAQNEEDYKKKFEAENKRKAELVAVGMDFSNEMGELLGNALMGNENLVASSLKSIINMGLDLLKVQVQMAVAGATAQSLAQADSVATFGASGLARAAILVGLIEAAFATVKSVIGNVVGNMGRHSSDVSTTATNTVTGSRVVTQRAAGKYDVIGADDGQLYRNVPYTGPARTGFVYTPTLMGEQGGELVVSAPDLHRLQRHINYPLIIRAINDARSGVVPQRAEGNYSAIPSQPQAAPISTADMAIMAEVRDLLRDLHENGVSAAVVLSDLQRQQHALSRSRKIGSK